MMLLRTAALALLSLSVAPARDVAFEPVPRMSLRRTGPGSETWTARAARVSAIQVRLNSLGARTHANWVLFRLPFDTNQYDRIRNVRYETSARIPTDVGELRVGSVCFDVATLGPVGDWTLYNLGGLGWSRSGRALSFAEHPWPPVDGDPTILAINVPTRVANYSACHGAAGLGDPETWSLDVTWEER